MLSTLIFGSCNKESVIEEDLLSIEEDLSSEAKLKSACTLNFDDWYSERDAPFDNPLLDTAQESDVVAHFLISDYFLMEIQIIGFMCWSYNTITFTIEYENDTFEYEDGTFECDAFEWLEQVEGSFMSEFDVFDPYTNWSNSCHYYSF